MHLSKNINKAVVTLGPGAGNQVSKALPVPALAEQQVGRARSWEVGNVTGNGMLVLPMLLHLDITA